MHKPFSFLIHAGDDKPRLAPVVRCLLDAGVNIWIDDPFHPALKLAREDIDRLAGYIVEGSDWSIQRNKALRSASSFLLCVSDASVERGRSEVHMEAAVADFRELEAKVEVFPLPLSQAELERGGALIGRRQGYKVYVEPSPAAQDQPSSPDTFALNDRGQREVMRLIKRLLDRQTNPPIQPLGVAELIVSPYLADRAAQSLDIADLLRSSKRTESARLQLPVLLGTIVDRPDKFALMKLPQRIVPHVLRTLKCPAVSLPWPHCVSSDPERALRLLVEEVQDHAPLPGTIVFYAQPAAADLVMPDGLRTCLELWCRAWSALTEAKGETVLIPVLDVRTDLLENGAGLKRFWRRKASTAKSVHALCVSLDAKYPHVSTRPLEQFGPVTWTCVEEWLREEISPVLNEAAVETFRYGLNAGFYRSGMAMEDWARRAHAVFGQHRGDAIAS